MIFQVTKDSTMFNKSSQKPIEEASEIDGREGWYIELSTLEDLVALQDKYGALELTFSFDHQYKVINIPGHN